MQDALGNEIRLHDKVLHAQNASSMIEWSIGEVVNIDEQEGLIFLQKPEKTRISRLTNSRNCIVLTEFNRELNKEHPSLKQAWEKYEQIWKLLI